MSAITTKEARELVNDLGTVAVDERTEDRYLRFYLSGGGHVGEVVLSRQRDGYWTLFSREERGLVEWSIEFTNAPREIVAAAVRLAVAA